MATKPQRPYQDTTADIGQQFRYYFQLFWRARWFILITGPAVTILSAAVIFMSAGKKPELSAAALIGLENISDMTAVRDVGGIVQAQSDIIKSRLFLEDVVIRHSFRLLVKTYNRSTVFDTVRLDSSAQNGNYYFKRDKANPGGYSIHFRPLRDKSIPVLRRIIDKPAKIYSGSLTGPAAITHQGMRLVLSSRFIKNPYDFAFDIIHKQEAVEFIFSNLTVKAADPTRGSFNIVVSMTGRDYPLIAEIVNAISDAFVAKNVNVRKGRSQDALTSLEKQLKIAKRDLAVAEGSLRNFRSANPSVGLSNQMKFRIDNLTQLETGVSGERGSFAKAQELLKQFLWAKDDSKLRLAGEILGFLSSNKNNAAPVLQNELNELLFTQKEIERMYASDHPLRLENQKKIDNLMKDILAALQSFISSLQTTLSTKSTEIQSMSSELKRLPSKELQLAELQRRQMITSDIYSTVLSRYNQGKVSTSADISESYVLDYALPPVPPPSNTLKLLLLALFLGTLAAFGPVYIADYFDKTVRTQYEFTRKTGQRFFESIPKISFRNKPRDGKPEGGDDFYRAAPIVSELLADTYAHESFRVLRTKLMLSMGDLPQKTICVTSMEAGAGKSTISANIACIIAQSDLPVIIVDADMRRGELHSIFGLRRNLGLTELLSSLEPLSVESMVQQTRVPNLMFLSYGNGAKNSSELLSSNKFADLINNLASQYAYVIIDAPPIGAITDAAVIASVVSRYLIVVKAGVTKVNDLMDKLAEFPALEKRLLGYILNFSTEKTGATYYKKSKYNK
ncbi:MAG: polysaccharide biosynthesis tyrosine autokinase [Chitinispirillaceae bacterium]|nr:polysaccharide biosynthesis tyrosine autokinase [Chitinispirillaceae bacterium]